MSAATANSSSNSRMAVAACSTAAAEVSSPSVTAAMDTESDDGEPKLEIVDEPMSVDVKTEVVSLKSSLPPPPPIPGNFVAFRKSVSYDGSGGGGGLDVARRMRVEETNANEAIESLLMLGREPVVSPQSREVKQFIADFPAFNDPGYSDADVFAYSDTLENQSQVSL